MAPGRDLAERRLHPPGMSLSYFVMQRRLAIGGIGVAIVVALAVVGVLLTRSPGHSRSVASTPSIQIDRPHRAFRMA